MIAAPRTFRDFAAAIMTNDVARGGDVLEELLGLEAAGALAAAQYFADQAKAGGPAFMGKAMGLRTAKASGQPDAIAAILRECFGLDDPALALATRTVAAAP